METVERTISNESMIHLANRIGLEDVALILGQGELLGALVEPNHPTVLEANRLLAREGRFTPEGKKKAWSFGWAQSY